MTQAYEIAAHGINPELTATTWTEPHEANLSLEMAPKLIQATRKRLEKKGLMGNVKLKNGETLWIQEKDGTMHKVSYSEYFGIPKKDPTKIRTLLNQGKAQMLRGVIMPNVNDHIIKKYAELGNLTDWALFFEGAESMAGDDIDDGFANVPNSPARMAHNGFVIMGRHFVLPVGVMGSREAPKGFGTLMGGAEAGITLRNPDIMLDARGGKCSMTHVDDSKYKGEGPNHKLHCKLVQMLMTVEME